MLLARWEVRKMWIIILLLEDKDVLVLSGIHPSNNSSNQVQKLAIGAPHNLPSHLHSMTTTSKTRTRTPTPTPTPTRLHKYTRTDTRTQREDRHNTTPLMIPNSNIKIPHRATRTDVIRISCPVSRRPLLYASSLRRLCLCLGVWVVSACARLLLEE